MGVNTSAGVRIFIGPVVDDSVETLSDLKVLSYTEIGEVESIAEFGDAANIITFATLGDRRVRKFKGSFDAGTPVLTLGRDVSDAGQAALKAAQATDFDYAIKVQFNDGSDGSPSEPTNMYFKAKVISYTVNIGGTEDITRSTVQLGINSQIFEEAAV